MATITGTNGNDSRTGGTGDDVINLLPGNDKGYGVNGADSLFGGNGNDSLFGGNGNDSLYGGNGNDSLYGGNGNDRLYGDAGNDSHYGGDGSDRLYGGNGNDTLDGGSGNDTVYGGIGNDIWNVTSNGNDTVYGEDGNDRLDGHTGSERLYGGNGSDTLLGDAGNDSLYGGIGNDSLDGGNGTDALFGGDGSDTVRGGLGDDRLSGGLGRDNLYGGTGADTFGFDNADAGAASAGGQADAILDFDAKDSIDLLASDITHFDPYSGFDPDEDGFTLWNQDGNTYVAWNTAGALHELELIGYSQDAFNQLKWLEDEFGTNAEEAGSISVNDRIASDIEVNGDRDWFEVSLAGGSTYQIQMLGNNLLDPVSDTYLRIYDGNGVLLESDDDGGTGFNARINFTPDASGVFFIEASAAFDSYAGDYTVSVFEDF